MRKKTITTLASIATTAVVLVGSYIFQNESDKLPLDVMVQDSVTQNSVIQSSSENSDNNQNNYEKSTSKKDSSVQNNSKQSTDNQSNSKNNTGVLEKTTFPESIIETQKEGIVPFGYINASVTKVTDGDTFHIKYDNQDYKVRMLDIDTPESVKSGVEQQPYSKEASDLTKEVLTGKEVKLIFEKDTTDQFNRLLAHVILEDGTYYNALLVQNGYAISVFYSPNTLLKDYYSELQSKAIENKAGFWKLPESKRPFIKDSKGKLVSAYKIGARAA